MPKIIITVGLPASGKDTWAAEYIKKDPHTKRVNKDLLRAMLDISMWSVSNEKFVLKTRDLIIQETLKNGQNIIVSDTNLDPKHIIRFKEIAKESNAKIEIVDHFLGVSPEECIKRDLGRLASVGAEVILGMYEKYIKPKTEKIIQDENLPKAVIFDIDGTLAKMHGRSPYEWNKVGEDSLNQPVYELYQFYKANNYKIVIFTARDGICEDLTKEWLKSNQIEWDYFEIRPAGNIEKDALIKRQMLDKIISKCYVSAIFDDRDQVVKMWRSFGLNCFQVDEGNF